MRPDDGLAGADTRRPRASVQHGWIATMAALIVCLACGGEALAREGEARDYAYFTLQGRLSDPSLRKPLEGATIHLTAGERKFQAVTDRKGVFSFEKLPVTSFKVEVVSSDGRVIRGIRRLDANDPVRPRLRMKLGKGDPQSFDLLASGEAVALEVPEPEVRWDRFWKQLAAFGAGALALALL